MLDNITSKLKNLNNKQKIIVVIIGLVLIILGFLFLYKTFYSEEPEIIIENEINEENKVEENIETESKIGIFESKKTVTVHVIGEVNTPGVVTLEEGARIIDAINAAGGKTEEADLSKINLAYVVEDGVQIYVPSITEVANVGENEKNSYIREDAGEGIIISTATQEEGEEKQTKVNINTANLEKLQTLPGIGESTARKIIEYREQNGKFQTIEDIKNVTGIGDSKFNSLKDLIVV